MTEPYDHSAAKEDARNDEEEYDHSRAKEDARNEALEDDDEGDA